LTTLHARNLQLPPDSRSIGLERNVRDLIRVMSVRRYQDLIAWQMAEAFKNEVFRIVLASPRACADRRYKDQLLAAAESVSANVAEGFVRGSPGDFRRFLRIALGSLVEAEVRLRDGIALSYFGDRDCELAFRYARRRRPPEDPRT
jgi:four helix bundle protein